MRIVPDQTVDGVEKTVVDYCNKVMAERHECAGNDGDDGDDGTDDDGEDDDCTDNDWCRQRQ